MIFQFATATEVVFGRGSLEGLAARVASLGGRVFVVTGSDPSRAGVPERLSEGGVEVTPFRIAAEPTTVVAAEGVARAREAGCEVVVGVGGGSVLDGAKAVAALLTNGGDPLDYLEVIGAGRRIEKPPARTWPWSASTAGWPWPTPASARCTASPAPSAACSARPTGLYALVCSRG